MRDFTLGVAQCAPAFGGSLQSNVSLIESYLDRAHAEGADLVAFPEATLSGYLLAAQDIRARAVAVSSDAVRAVVELTTRSGIYCAFGFYERDNDRIYNSYALAGEGKLVGVYRKVHIPPRETGLFTAGASFQVFDLPFARIGLSICYDNEFPESHTCLALLGAEVILMPAGWADHWERQDYVRPCVSDEAVVAERIRWMHMMFGARCRDSGTYSALINHSGLEVGGPSRFVGKSMIFAPTGEPIAQAQAWDDDLIYGKLDAQLLADYRNMDAYTLRARKPEAYGPLVAQSESKSDGS